MQVVFCLWSALVSPIGDLLLPRHDIDCDSIRCREHHLAWLMAPLESFQVDRLQVSCKSHC